MTLVYLDGQSGSHVSVAEMMQLSGTNRDNRLFDLQ